MLPAPLLQRLACCHLVDNVRGQTLPFAPAEIAGELEVEIVAVSDDRIDLDLRGATTAESAGPWLLGDSYWQPDRDWPRTLRTVLLGRASYDRKHGSFAAFDLVALGYRRGRTRFNGRGRSVNDREMPIGFVFTRAATGTLRVAPTFINVYGADWVVPPK